MPVECPENTDEQCVVEVEISMLAKPTDDSLQISLNWGTFTSQLLVNRGLATISPSQDLDIHLLQMDKADTRVFCETYFATPSGCQNTALNYNVQEGGSRREIVTIDDIASHAGQSTYMIFADDNSVSGASLFESGARVTITNGQSARVEDMPDMTEDTVAGSRYWLVGCLELSVDSFDYVPINTFSRDSPAQNEKFYCHNLFKNGGVVLPEEPFCPNVDLKVSVHDALNNDDVSTAVASIVLEDGSNEYTIASGESLAEDGFISAGIKRNGRYVVRVEAEGYMTARKEYTVNCRMTECGACEPTLLVALSPTLNPGELRMVLSWAEKPRDLDIYVMRRNVREWSTTCTTNYQRRSGCGEATLDLDNTRGGNFGVETVTIHDIPSYDGNVYMVFVQHYGYNRITEEFGTSEAQIAISDGVRNSVIQLSPTSYSQEKHWLAGCLKITGSSYDFSPVNMFLNNRPDQEVPDLCLDTFGLSTTTTTTPAPRRTTTRRPWYRRIFG